MEKHKPSDYHAIALWGEECRVPHSEILARQKRAAADGAPLNAIFDWPGDWWTTDTLPEGNPFHGRYARYLEDLLSGAKRPFGEEKV